MNFTFLSKILVILFLYFIQKYVDAGKYCKTASSATGECMNIWKCKGFMSLMNHGPHSMISTYFLMKSVCSTQPDLMVCCPEKNDKANNQILKLLRSVALPRPPFCGFNIDTRKILSGRDSKLGEFPWMALLRRKNTNKPFPKGHCGGSLITSTHILTAAHCFDNGMDLDMVRVGDLDLMETEDGAMPMDAGVEKITLHENYNIVTSENDIAIIKLNRPISGENISPICLPIDEWFQKKSLDDETVIIAGWGRTEYDGLPSDTLLTAKLPVVSTSDCKKSNSRLSNMVIDERVICAGLPEGKVDTCSGDSGGPLVLNVKTYNNNTFYYQVGIVSVGYKCGEPGFPGVYTKVTHFINWIKDHLD